MKQKIMHLYSPSQHYLKDTPSLFIVKIKFKIMRGYVLVYESQKEWKMNCEY